MNARAPNRAQRWWLRYWNTMRRYHRYSVRGFEHLEGDRPVLIVGYHGKPIAHDLCMLQCLMWERLGYLGHPIFHAGFEELRLKQVLDDLGFLVADGPELQQALDRGEHVIVTPGGTREGCRSSRHRHQVHWGRRTGYLRLALKYGLDVVPVGAWGVDHTYLGLNDGDATSRRLGVPAGIPVWLGLGPLGVWPVSPPFPVRFRQVIGAPIALPDTDPQDREALLALHGRVTGQVQTLIEEARHV